MGINYIMGFKDATDILVGETNRVIKELENTTSREALVNAIDAFISTTYIMRLQYERLEEETLEEMEEELEENCTDCGFSYFCDKECAEPMTLQEILDKLYKEEI